MNAAQLWQKIKPFAIRDLVNSSTGGGNTGASVALHSLNGPYHTGILARSQAPWVATDIASSIATHATLPNVHHAQGHVLATTTGLGADHTTSGLTTGQVLRATGATTAQFMALTNGDIVAALGYTPVDRAGDTMSGTLGVQPSSNVVSAFEVRDATGIPVFSIDTLNFRVGFGRNDPQAKFHIYTSADDLLRLESSGATGNPFVSWYQAGTRRAFVQFNDTNDTLIISSEYGDVSIRAAATAGSDSDTPYITIKAGGNIGLHTATPSYPLHLSKSWGAIAAATVAITGYFTASGNGDAAGTSGLRAQFISASVGGANAMSEATALNIESNSSRSAGTLTSQLGINLGLRITGSGSTANMWGFSSIPILSAAGGVTGYRAFNARSPSITGAGTITNAYGLYVEAQKATGVGTGYALYAAGENDLSYIAGSVGVGIVPTTYKFEVSGTARVSSTLYATTVSTVSGDLTLTANSGAIVVSGASIGGVNWNIFTSGDATFAGSVYTPAVVANGSDLTVTSVSNNLILNGTSNVDVRISGVSQWTMTNARLLPRSTLTMDIGDSNRRIRTLHAGELNVEILVAQSVMATIGGRIIVSPTNKLLADVALAATTIDVAYNNFVNGEYIYLSAAPGGSAQIEAMQVTSSATAISGGYRYSVSRNLDGTGANIWYAGDAVVSLRSAVGQGYIDLTSTNTIHNHYGPTQTFYVRTATTNWNSVAPVVSAGNLRSFVDYSADEFGFATGNDLTLLPSAGFRGVTVDRTNGVRLFNTDIRLYNAGMQTLNINSTGTDIWVGTSSSNKRLHWDGATLNFNNSSGTAVITFDNSGASYFAGPMTIGSSGGIYQGSGTFASPTTGLKIWNDSGVGRIGGYNAGTLQCSIDTDGKFKSGDNRIEISASGGVRARITNNAYDGLLFINNDIVNYPPFYLAGLNAYSNNTLGEARSSWYASHINNQSYPVQIELRAANNANASIIIFKNALVGINQDTASYALDVNGSCHASSFPTSSDRRFKEALTPLSPVLDRLGRIGTYNFYWRRNYAGYEQFLDEGRPQLQVGFVAQEVEQEFPELISRWRHVGRDGVATDDAYSVDYARMVPILVQAIRELRAELSALKSQ